MARTTSTLVQGILGGNWDGKSSLTPYIATATAIIDRVVVCATAKELTLSDTTLELMERWMAAYYYTKMDPLYRRKKTERAEGDFGDRSYKEAALDLDHTGCLNSLLGKVRAGGFWLGKAPSDQTDYVDRD